MNNRLLRGVAGLVGLFLIWELVSLAGLVNSFLLPPPTAVLDRLVTMFGEADFVSVLIATVLTWLLSLAITVGIAVPVGILLGSVPGVRNATNALVDLIRPVPAIALFPVATVLLSGGVTTAIALAVFAGFWPMLFNVIHAIQETDPMLLDTARTFGLGRFAVARRVRLPAITRAIVVGVRISVSIELIVILSVELLTPLGLDGALGAYLANAGQVGDLSTVFAGTLLVGLLGYLANQGLLALEGIRRLHPVSTGAREADQRRAARWPVRLVTQLAVLVGVVAVWQLATARWNNFYAPTPTKIAASLWQNLGLIGVNAPDSMAKLGVALAIAIVCGVGLGLLLGMSTVAADIVEPTGAFIRSIPPVLLVPVLQSWAHLGTPLLEITTIALGCTWPLFVQTIEGVRTIEPVLLATSRGYRIGRLRQLCTVVAPAAAPKIFTGLRISVSLALILMVVAETVGSVPGLGFQLDNASGESDFPLVWACFVVLGVLGYLLNHLVVGADRLLVSWRHETVNAE